MEGRRQMAALLAARKVFIGDEAAPAVGPDMFGDIVLMKFLEQCCATGNKFGFQFVFIPKKGAPDAWSTVLSAGNPILDGARNDIETAIYLYKKAKAEYGVSRWLPGHEVEELDVANLPYAFGRSTPRRQ